MTGFHRRGGPGMGRGPPWARRPIEEKYERKVPDRVLVSRLMKYVLLHRKRLAIVLTAIIATTLIGLIRPIILRTVVDDYIFKKDFAGLSFLSLALIGLLVVNWLLGYFQRRHMGWMGKTCCMKCGRKCSLICRSYHSASMTDRRRGISCLE